MNPASFSPPDPHWDNFVKKMYVIGGVSIALIILIGGIAMCQ